MAIVFARGQVAGRKIPGVIETSGGMVATGLGPEALEKYIARVTSGQVMVACLNSPSSTTASGDASAVEELESLLKQDDIFARRLKINAAYHSHHMQVLAAPYLEWLQRLFGPQEHMNEDIIYSSPTTGKRETSGRMISNPQHWVNSFANPVRFVESFHNMCFADSMTTISDVDIVIEVGPHAALGGPIQEIIAQPNFHSCKVGYLPTLVRKSDAVDTMQTLAAYLLKAGYPVNMEAVNFPNGQSNAEVLYDLPSYPWTHKTRHWSEPRINKTHRHRTHAANDLLGSFVLGTNMMRPSWRHVIRLNDLPWLRDHVVQSTLLYPGAGFICMAIEGAAQLAQDRGDQVTGYQLRDIEVLKGLQIPDTAEGIEVQLTLEPCNEKAIYAAGCQEFHVYSVNSQEQWTEHCKGLIHVETSSVDPQQASIALQSRLSQLSLHKPFEEYRKNINPMDVYDAMHFVQICHGPIFQNLDSIKVNGRQSIVAFSVADTAATMPYRHESDYVVHPTTIDSLFQAAYAGYIAVPDANMSASFIPRIIKKLYVAHNIPKDAGRQFTAYCDVVGFTQRGFDTDLLVVSETENGSKTPLLKIDHYITQSLGNVKSTTGDAYDKLSTLHWGPDLSLPNEAYLEKQLSFESDALTNLKRVCFHFIQDAIDALTIADVAQLKSHHKKYYVWIKLQRELALQNKLAHNSSEWLNDSLSEIAALTQQVLGSGKAGEDICRYGPYILPILRGDIDPADLEQAEVDTAVTTLNSSQSGHFHAQVAEYVRLFTHHNPRSKILEIGGGAGTVTTNILNAIGLETNFLAESYTFTDVTSELVSAAEEKFRPYAGLVQCKEFDVEQDIFKQGFEGGSYNLIILSDTQQVTRDSETNLKNIRKLLSPNGKILILEEGKLPFILGLFPDPWTTGK
jgi:acyl transferase domain-containing protein